MNQAKSRLWCVLNIILGILSFLIILPGPFFWVGFSCAAASLILGTIGKKRPEKNRQICAIVGIVLALAAAIVFVVTMYVAGYGYVEIL